MTVIISILLLVFGLDPSSGKAVIYSDSKAQQQKPKDYRAEAARQSQPQALPKIEMPSVELPNIQLPPIQIQ